MAQEKQLRQITIRVDAGDSGKQIKEIANGFSVLNKNIKGTKDILDGFRSFGAGLAGLSIFGFGAKELIDISDSIQLLKDRIKGLIPETESVTDVITKLNAVSSNTKSSLTDTASLFARVSVATKDLGLSTDAILGLLNGLQQSYRLAGATAQEASNSTVQFTQALSLGVLRGQDLKSVISQNAPIARVFARLAREAGQDTLKFAEAGRLTSQVVLPALAKEFAKMNEQASKLSQTFGQTLTLAMNTFTLKVGELSESIGFNSKFAKAVEFLIENIPQISGVFAAFAAVALPALIAKFTLLALAINPVAVALGAMVVAMGVAGGSFETFSLKIVKGLEAMSYFANKTKQSFFELLDRIPLVQSSLSSTSDKLKQSAAQAGESARKNAASIKFINEQILELDNNSRKGAGKPIDIGGFNKALEEQSKNLPAKIKTIKEQLGEINVAFNKLGDPTQEDVKKFNDAISKLKTRELKDQLRGGEIGIQKFREELQQIGLENATREFQAGIITFQQLEAARKNFKVEELTRKFQEGKYPLREYMTEVARLGRDFGSRLYTELSEYVTRTGDLFQNLSRGIVGAFGHLEDALVDFTKTGQFNFRKFTQAVLDDLNRIIIRSLVIRPLAEGLLGALGSSGDGSAAAGSSSYNYNAGTSTAGATAAHGHAFSNGRIQAYAAGGIVSTPTLFGYGGKVGLMGEAGTEAILPLKRGPNGDLGVQSTGGVTINILNNSGAGVETSERVSDNGERTVDIMIAKSVKEHLSNGTFDRAFTQLYGLRRKGT